jgi:GT2 family glycosyltransferase/ADP-heptose:LPS heptosyltransferase
MQRVTVCTATKNRLFVLHQLLWSLRNQTYPYWDLVIVDDSDGEFNIESWEKDEMYKRIIAELRKRHKVQIIPSERTGKLGAALQEGFLYAEKHWRNPLFCRADDDHWLDTNWLEQLVPLFDSDPKIGAVSGLVLDPGSDIQIMKREDERVHEWGKISSLSSAPNLQWIRHESSDLIDVEHLTCPMIVRTDVLRDIGGFDTHLFDHFREETYFSWRFFLEGYRVVIAPWVECWHLRAPSGGTRKAGNPLDDARKFNIIRKSIQPGIHVNLTHAMGDLIASTPMFEQLRKKYPSKNISVWHPLAKEVFEGNPNIDYICNSALDGQRTRRVELSIYGWMGKNKWTGHISNAYCQALGLSGLDNIKPSLYNIDPEEGDYVVIVNASNAKIFDFSDFSRTKHWAVDRWHELIEWIKSEYNTEVIQLSGPEVIEPLDGVRLVNDRSYRDSFRLIAGARCVVGIDTMGIHAAVALGVPAVVMFGRSSASMYGYYLPNIVNLQLECPKDHPCNGGVPFGQDRKHCPIPNHPCMDHSVEEVKSAVRSVIDRRL